jgi:hypothetical protein
VLVLVGAEPLVRMGGLQVRGQVQVHQLAGEAGRRPERGELPPGAGAVAGLLLELAAGGDLRVLDNAGRRVDVQRAGGNLEKNP